MTKYIVALDQGTTSSRAILFDRAGMIVELAQQTFPQIYPAPGLVGHDPEDIWSTQIAVAQAVMRQAGVSAAEIAAI
jgi:glycerol kinase